ncbi:mannitol dehydrogenase family protein [Rhodovibrionaceae bacterium A322]
MSQPPLSLATLPQLAPGVTRSPLEGRDMAAGIVHLGIGAFHRAHQAFYTQQALARHPGDWGIVGVSLRSPTVRDQLARQDNLYSLVSLSEQNQSCQLVSVVRQVLFAPEDPEAVIAALADPRTEIITLTVTEKGYCHDPASGTLRRDDPGICNDLDGQKPPQTALGFLLRGLLRRQAEESGPVTVISCDNLPENGRVLSGLLTEFATLAAPELLPWMAANVTCPCSMVDCIVPAATDCSLDQAEVLLGLRDEAAILCEDFRQWVIEDDFAGGRPAWETAGVELVADVRPYEDMKLRLLNGSHSALAYLGYLGGYHTIADVMLDPLYRSYCQRLIIEEAGCSLELPEGYDVEQQAERLLLRFSNRKIAHRTWQIAMDGSQKLPQRLLASLYDQMSKGRPMPCTLLAVAAWIVYVGGRDEQGQSIVVSDPLAPDLAALHVAADGDIRVLVESFLALSQVFGPVDEQPRDLGALLVIAVTALYRDGARTCVARLNGE